MKPDELTIVVCGGGLAGSLAALALANALSPDVRIVHVSDSGEPADDFLYGSATAPDCHNFLHALGLDERTLLLESNTAFSYGTDFRQWAAPEPWMLCHHAPFPAPDGIPLRHFLTRTGAALAPLLISAQAAALGRFAHPPENPQHPLSRAEYGYQFVPDEWAELADRLAAGSRIERIREDLASVERHGDLIRAVRTATGKSVCGDLFIDASGQDRHVLGPLSSQFRTTRRIRARVERSATPHLGAPCRMVEATASGWSATTQLQDSQLKIHIDASSDDDRAPESLPFSLGRLDEAWVGNCVGVGHAAWAVEPLTPAPMMLLQRDIERLLELVPASKNMAVERREYNRRFNNDLKHVGLFHDALYRPGSPHVGAFAPPDLANSPPEALQRKITQFENRGALVSYDLDPFNEEDWTQNHIGMGRSPRRHDRQLDAISLEQAEQTLATLRTSVEQVASRMPPHHVYLARFKAYLEKPRHA